MIKRFVLALAAFAALVVSLGAVKVAQIREMAAIPRDLPPVAVTSIRAETAVWRPTINAIATLAPVEGVTLAADADGTVVRIAVENGASVPAGEVLIELDTSVEAAQLAAAVARQAIARLDRDRATELRAKNTISQAESDAAIARVNQAEADVAALQALLNKKVIRGPRGHPHGQCRPVRRPRCAAAAVAAAGSDVRGFQHPATPPAQVGGRTDRAGARRCVRGSLLLGHADRDQPRRGSGLAQHRRTGNGL
jgi:multidrug efflux pump subunit AcrA (membrane-fusion protein)